MQKQQILKSSDPTIHLRVSGDGRNVGRKIKHVMVTFMILNHEDKHHHADYHYTIALYPGTEKYDLLKFMLNPFLDDADWKFLAICLGLNGPTANYFCPWCLCSKHQHGDLNKDWHIEKNMEQIATRYSEVNGHIFPPLFDMISIDHIVFDELHVLLRITDRLWELMLAEIQECNLFNSITRKVILDEMLQLKLLFKPSCAQLIRKLWDEFYKLYCAIRNKNTNPAKLKQQSLEWLSLFLTPSQGNPSSPKTFIQGLYMPSQVTPYMHALVYHGWELLEKHQRWGLKAFSCSAVEKKNHNQVSTFFRKTLKNGGNLSKRKSAIQEIIEYENRTHYYTYNTLPESPKIKRVHIK
ncbi:14325_t:CDS:2 [Entrophospora sp. SA101]|nr:14325_t:CDS:2 [Entrophospora sp. SA101]